MYLSLPLPARKRRFDVHVVPMRGPAALVRLVHSLCSLVNVNGGRHGTR
jgi:hypothetical protein